jgi:hypothetical protein
MVDSGKIHLITHHASRLTNHPKKGTHTKCKPTHASLSSAAESPGVVSRMIFNIDTRRMHVVEYRRV